MPPILSTEYENQNSKRNFPFADSATLTDAQGNALPVNFIIDAFLYPIDIEGVPYISQINTATRRIRISDSATSSVIATATYSQDGGSATVVDTTGARRDMGILVFGTGVGAVGLGEDVRVFTAEATSFTPTAFVSLNQVGVRGIKLPNGTVLTGDVTIEGRDGVVVSSRVEDGLNILRVDILGALPDTVEGCDATLGVPLQKIRAHRIACSAFIISKYDAYTLALTTNGVDLDTLAEGNKARHRPDDREPCDEPAPTPVDPPCGAEVILDFDLNAAGAGVFAIVAPSATGYRNPLFIRSEPPVVVVPRIRLNDIAATGDLARQMTKLITPTFGSSTLVITMQCLGKGQLP